MSIIFLSLQREGKEVAAIAQAVEERLIVRTARLISLQHPNMSPVLSLEPRPERFLPRLRKNLRGRPGFEANQYSLFRMDSSAFAIFNATMRTNLLHRRSSLWLTQQLSPVE